MIITYNVTLIPKNADGRHKIGKDVYTMLENYIISIN